MKQTLESVLTNITVRCMLNPENADFYIGTLTLEKIERLFVDMKDTDISTVFWKAYAIARAKYAEQQVKIPATDVISVDEYAIDYTVDEDCCPECGCTTSSGYVIGVRCPNCDYTEE